MSEINENRRIIEQTRLIASLTPDRARMQAAMDSVRQTLQEKAQRESALRFSFRRMWVISSGLAAMVAVALLILSVLPPHITAAQQFQEAANVTSAYKGWVHIRVTSKMPTTRTATTTPMASPENVRMHFNTIDNRLAIEMEFLNSHFAQISEPAKNEQMAYSALTRQVHLAALNPGGFGYNGKEIANVPLNLAQLLSLCKEGGLQEPEIVRRDENGLDRFDLKFHDDPKRLPEKFQDYANGISVWTDPQTKLIRRTQMTLLGGTIQVIEFSYGGQEIRDIYDLGVPRNAKIVDDRPTTMPTTAAFASAWRPTTQPTVDTSVDRDALLARLRDRIDKGYGDGVALICEEQQLRPHENSAQRQGAIDLIGQQGNSLMRAHYLAAPMMGMLGGVGFPKGWPTPKLEDTLAMLKTPMPVQITIADKNHFWQANGSPLKEQAKAPMPDGAYDAFVASQRGMFGFSYNVWPLLGGVYGNKQATTRMTFPGDSSFKIVRDPTRPELIGLSSTMDWPGQGPDKKGHLRNATTYWIDPSRDDMPVAKMTGGNSPTDEKEEWVQTTLYLDYAQLANGQWYPTHWMTVMNGTRFGNGTDYTSEFHAQLFPNAKLDSVWFTEPAKRWRSVTMTPALTFIPTTQASTRP